MKDETVQILDSLNPDVEFFQLSIGEVDKLMHEISEKSVAKTAKIHGDLNLFSGQISDFPNPHYLHFIGADLGLHELRDVISKQYVIFKTTPRDEKHMICLKAVQMYELFESLYDSAKERIEQISNSM